MMLGVFFLAGQHSHDGIKQHLLFNRFKQVTRATQRFKADCVSALSHGGEDKDFDISSGWIALDGAGGLFAIHAGHLHIE